LENLGLDGNLKLLYIAEKLDNMLWVLFVRLRMASGGTL